MLNVQSYVGTFTIARIGTLHATLPSRRRQLSLVIRSMSSADSKCGWPWPVSSSDPIVDRKSVFLAKVTHFPSPSYLPSLLAHLVQSTPRLKRASHPAIYAFRCIQEGSSLPVTGSDDNGENGAGKRLARLLDLNSSNNCIIVVTRWYGGVQLGSDRWRCISSVAKQALQFHRDGGQSCK